MKYNTLHEHVKAYIEAGWREPLPLPAGQKFPPPDKTTGNISVSTREAIEELWQSAGEDSNLAIRIPDGVIGIDIDAHGGKVGDQTLEELERELGKLPETHYSTRHGKDASSRHMFFRVPLGIKWTAKAGKDIDVIQHTHRYAVVEPSTKDGATYKWYPGLPRVQDLPELPQAWVDYLTKGSLNDYMKTAPTHDLNDAEGVEWLRSVALDFDGELSSALKTGIEKRAGDFQNDAHDAMVSSQSWAIRFAVLEGATGLGAALEALYTLFSTERAKRGRGESPQREWDRSLTGEINSLRGRIERGQVRPMIETIAGGGVDTVLPESAKSARAVVDEILSRGRHVVTKYGVEAATGELLSLILPESVALVAKGEESDVYDAEARAIITGEEIVSAAKNLLPSIVSPLFKQIPEDADEEEIEQIEGFNKKLTSILSFANAHRNRLAMKTSLAVALRDQGRTVNRSDIDAQPELLGLPDGRVIDLNLALEDPEGSLTSWVRDREYGELVESNLNIDIEEAEKAFAHRKTYPDGQDSTAVETFLEVAIPNPEVRRVAQKVLGYAAYGRTDSEYRNLPVFLGDTSTGKTVLSDLLKNVAGDYYGTIGIESLTLADDRPNSALFKVIHCRWVVMPELATTQKAASERLKALTSTEGVSAHAKYSNHVVTSTTITPIIVTNEAPSMRIDSAMLKRLVVIPMDTPSDVLDEALPPRHGRPRLDVYGDKTFDDWKNDHENKAAFLRWLIEGYVAMVNEGIDQESMPDDIKQAVEAFAGEADPLSAWLKSLDFDDPTAVTSRKELEADFADYDSSVSFPSGASLQKMMESKGAIKDRDKRGIVYRGVKVPGKEDQADLYRVHLKTV